MERFTLLVTSSYLGEVHARQIKADTKEGALRYADSMELKTFAVFRESDVELLTYLYYRVAETDVCKWMRGIIYHAAMDKPSYWLLVDDDSELEDDNLLNTVRKVVMEEQRRRKGIGESVYPEFLHELRMYEIEQATPEELHIHDDGIGDLDEDEDTLTDIHGYMTIHVCDVDNEENTYTFRVPMERVEE